MTRPSPSPYVLVDWFVHSFIRQILGAGVKGSFNLPIPLRPTNTRFFLVSASHPPPPARSRM